YTSPANDFGTLVKNANGTFTYTAKNQWKWNFNSSGYETSLVDPHNVTITYTWTGSNLTGVAAPDGGLTTITYNTDPDTGQKCVNIVEPANRTVTVSLSPATSRFTSGTDVDGSGRSFSYDSSSRLINDQWSPLNVTYTYDSTTGLLSSAN